MKNEFVRFLLKSLFFAAFVGMGYMILYRIGLTPTVTNSALFDKKMFLIQKHGLKDVKIMGMGASIPLYALNSDMINQYFHMSYYNFGTWRLQIEDMRYLLKIYVDEHHPQYLILVSSIGDFRRKRDSIYLNYGNTSAFVRNHLPELFYLKDYSSVYEIEIRRHTMARIMHLDPWGGVPMTIPYKDRDPKAWDERYPFPTAYTSYEYRQLDTLADFLRERKIRLIFVQAPIKAAYANTPVMNQVLTNHFDSCKRIVEADGGVYLNYYDTGVFADSLFFDQYHLQVSGGRLMTKELLNDLRTIIK